MTAALFSFPKWRQMGAPDIHLTVRKCKACGVPINARLLGTSGVPEINKQCKCTGHKERWDVLSVAAWSQVLLLSNQDTAHLLFFAQPIEETRDVNPFSYVIEKIDALDYDFQWVLRSTDDGTILAGAQNSHVLALVLDALTSQQKA